MDFSGSTSAFQNTPLSFWLVGAAVIILVFFSVKLFVNTPLYSSQFQKITPTMEGFSGVPFGAGDPPCMRDLDGAVKVLEILSKMTCGEKTDDDLRELALLLGKLACLKKDLMSPSGMVLNTRHLQYETQHDREPVAEVAAQCLSRTIPSRDLDIIFGTYKRRGLELIKNLSTHLRLAEVDVRLAESNFQKAWADVYEVAQGRCLATDQNGSVPGENPTAGAYLPPSLDYLKTYQGYY